MRVAQTLPGVFLKSSHPPLEQHSVTSSKCEYHKKSSRLLFRCVRSAPSIEVFSIDSKVPSDCQADYFTWAGNLIMSQAILLPSFTCFRAYSKTPSAALDWPSDIESHRHPPYWIEDINAHQTAAAAAVKEDWWFWGRRVWPWDWLMEAKDRDGLIRQASR